MNIPSVTKQEVVVEDTVQTDVTTETTEVATLVIDTPETPEPAVDDNPQVTQHESVEGAFTGNDRIPALWNIMPTEDDIEATNSTTQNRFVGTIADFNAKLKG